MTENSTLVVALTRKLPEGIEKRMAELFDLIAHRHDRAMTRRELQTAVETADVLVPTLSDSIDAELLSHASPRLKLIAQYGAGTDNIDIDAAHRAGITVTNTSNVLNEDTADMTMALILAGQRRLVEGSRQLLSDGAWPGWSPDFMLGKRLSGKKLGILGMGRIGTAVARRARAFGLEIHYHNRSPVSSKTETELAATYWDSLDQMLPKVDILSVNCPYTPATYHLLSRRRLSLMQPEAFLINTARGEIIDEPALIDLLEQGKIGGAGLDVFEAQPTLDPRLVRLAQENRVILLPHMASATREARIDMGEKVIINIRTFMDGHRPPDRILPNRA
ncbi:D-glycerate dehydrogenase [Aureimonas fodinaquatilis]|uniref:D-glycerate dehydrogenase n=1 Tax=Aureimonas fodinaquatilis TaxID=2565783 RepID=A0A5B0E1R0_9HYPH|nr:D-glycerate dehydrogenase [Aureimonas fodinaquatilis]KAA0971670.1 D-glycerate dehydrogenase [Aureimonas fodinaquatilis]